MPRALIVESSPQDFTACESLLAAAGYDVQGTNDGNEGLKLARSFAPDVVLLTVELQGMSGYSICNKMKKDPQLARVPLVLVSRDASEEIFSQHRRLRTHADAYLRKPIAKAELEAAVAEAQGGARAAGFELSPDDGGGDAAAFDGAVASVAAPPAAAPSQRGAEVTVVPVERTQVAPQSSPQAPGPTPLGPETTMAEALAERVPAPPLAAAAPAAAADPGGTHVAEATVVRPVDPLHVAATLPARAEPVVAPSPLEQQLATMAALLQDEREGRERLGGRLREAEQALQELTAQLSRERLARQTALGALGAAQRALEASAATDAQRQPEPSP